MEWRTESRHPLSDRLIRQGRSLYGVRFGTETQYCLIDIDADSLYHPNRDTFAVGRIAAALECLGLVEYITCTSSYSGGLHLYFPFPKAHSSWQLAIAVATLLEQAGFQITPGQLEILPNPKPYVPDTTPSLFNAHRLPLQSGSYLLNADFQPIWSTQQTFVEHWQFAQHRNALDIPQLKQLLKQAKRKVLRVSGKAEKFIQDLNAEIESGWTGHGQTNRLLGRITMRAYIFQHVLSGGQPLAGTALVEEIVATAKSLPGYQDWCRHQHEIEQRAEEWARCIQASHYFPYGDSKGKFKPKLAEPGTEIEQVPSWNQQQSQAARERIRYAIADLLEQGKLPTNATARFKTLVQYKIGGGSLYRHRDLWHPRFLENRSSNISECSNISKPDCSDSNRFDSNTSKFDSNTKTECITAYETSTPILEVQIPTSLLSSNGGNPPTHHHSGDFDIDHSGTLGRNLLENRPLPQVGSDDQDQVADLQAWQEAHQEALRLAQVPQPPRDRTPSASQIARMQQYFHSGDPILQAEALAWLCRHPGGFTPVALQAQEQRKIGGLYHSSVQAAIQAHLERLGWSPDQVRDRLQALFSQTGLFQLTDSELIQWLTWLQGQG